MGGETILFILICFLPPAFMSPCCYILLCILHTLDLHCALLSLLFNFMVFDATEFFIYFSCCVIFFYAEFHYVCST